MQKYQVLSRKYRPQTFHEIIHQELPVQALLNAFKSERIGHAYIFFGPRGVGKTSIARILAKRLNCEKPKDNEPCNECNSCVDITKGSSNDVLEIDAASHRGIEHIRELRENVKFNAMGGKYRIYIIDEVHMLSEPAFNALLKTLEEPPPHIVFILATTEHHKIPDTILSRCQDFLFKKVPISVLSTFIEKICKNENFKYDPDGIFWIAKKGDGSVRDTLSFMEQAVVFTDGILTGVEIRKLVDYHGIDSFINFILNTLKSDGRIEIYKQIESFFIEGRDIQKFIWDLLEFLMTLQLIMDGITDRENLNLPQEDIIKVKEAFRSIEKESILLISERIYNIHEKLSTLKLRTSFEIKTYTEIQIRKLFQDLDKPSVSGILSKLQELTKAIEESNLPSLPNMAPPSPNQISKPDSKKESQNLEEAIKESFSGTEVSSDSVPDI
jgi:DNA polymerase-3 subunit gamma/tau